MTYILEPDLWIGALISFLIPFGCFKLFKWLKNYNFPKKKKRNSEDCQRSIHDYNAIKFTDNFRNNLQVLREILGHSSDVTFRQFQINNSDLMAAVVFVDGLVDKTTLQEQIIKPLLHKQDIVKQVWGSIDRITKDIADSVISIAEVKKVSSLDDCISEVLSGSAALLIDGYEEVLILGAQGGESRAIQEPISEEVVRGPRDGFNENLRTNTVLIRRRIKDPNLTIINYTVGSRSQTNLALIYIKGLTNQDLVEEVKRRIEQIDIDEVPESGYIEQLIEDNYLSPFPQIQNTERPDRVASALMEGQFALLLDGTPFALIAPVTFSMLMTSPEDYYQRWLPASLLRIMRYGSAFMALFLPSLYIALISYNHGLIPTKLVMSIIGSREDVPFPGIVEGLIMEVTLEILREAGLRLPKQIGQTVGIVGGLVIGQAAVEAGIVSPIMVIVVALTAISSFTFPQYGVGIAIRILRFGMMLVASVFGLYGIIMFYILIMAHLVKLKSFGVNYLSPFVPYRMKDWKDSIIRIPLKMMNRRPETNKSQDHKRQ
ncbi:spore germination protein [Bacillus sp. BRMEA1]|uniref:spore germination protein n=1 Tax=Neobacillus endophyticus TaxID=2738405 RepID=UPI001564E1AE|nr:spore germination protein [Neobacillus endophyticus]NRD77740.1 spore germination protein [Neobacillus endophyticus]